MFGTIIHEGDNTYIVFNVIEIFFVDNFRKIRIEYHIVVHY